jgi:3-hydroxybutyryl-CoA dehydrogenase
MVSQQQQHICVVGAGTMGRGIAQVALGGGHRVSLVDPAPSQLRAASEDILGRITRRDPDARPEFESRLTAFDSLGSVTGSGETVVVEAALEDLATKQAILGEALALFGPGCILATNTSSLSITEVARGVAEPSRVVGMHFFNPAPAMRLVEVVGGLQTDPAVADAIVELARSWGKEPIRVKSAPGFIVNRVARPFYGEALRLLEEDAASPELIDELLRSSGQFRMGPFELMDLIGLDVNFTVTCTVWAAFNYDPRFAPSSIQRELVAGGFYGRKSGQGFYRYDGETERPVPPAMESSVPTNLVLRGDCPELAILLDRAGLTYERAAGHPSLDLGDRGIVLLTSGRTASAESHTAGRPVVLLDRCLDWTTVTALGVSGTTADLVSAAAALLGQAGVRAYPVADVPGLVLARIVSMLANEAWETVSQRTAAPADVDTAMRLGANYPQGPIAWAEEWRNETVLEILDGLWDEYHDPRYRASALLRRAVRASSD